LILIDREEVRERLTYEVCIPIVRQAMIALSAGETRQLLRSIIPLADGRMFGIMPGALGERAAFGAKLISIYPENFAKGMQSHQGVVLLFDPETGAPVCIAHAGEVTAIRTAAATAVATDALARPDATRLALLGYGEQAETHLRALRHVRPIMAVTVWGRSPERAKAFAERMSAETGLPVVASADAKEAVAEADIVCTLSGAAEPILEGIWVRPGTHLNLVGSSRAGPSEVDNATVVMSRYIADYREGVLAQGAEFLHAKQAGLVDDSHVVGEIGQVLSGALEHIVQDLAAVQALYEGRV